MEQEKTTSFSALVKAELCRAPLNRRCCAQAEAYGVLLYCNTFRGDEIILVFDAYKVKGNPGSLEQVNGVYVAYTKEAQTADAYIERATYDLAKEHRVRVATSDGPEQLIILGHGALRLSARAFRAEVEQTRGEIASFIARNNVRTREENNLKNTANIKKS